MHRKEGHHHDSEEEGVGVEEPEECTGEIPLLVERDAAGDVPHGDADQEGGEKACNAESDIPGLAPGPARFLAPELNRHRAKDQGDQKEHERIIKTGKNSRIGSWKSCKERATAGDEPDFVSVPDGADGIQQDATILVLLHKEVEDSDTEVESIQNRISGEEYANQDEPDDVQVEKMIEMMHGREERGG